MELTPEEFEEGKRKFIERERINFELSEKETEYRQLTANNDLILAIEWEDEIKKIDRGFLLDKINIKGLENLEENFTVIYLSLDKILNFYCESESSADEIYPKNQLWDTCRANSKITQIISHIEEGKSVCPPVIDFTICSLTNKEIFALYDGNHRIGLCRYLGLKSIPFLVRKSNENRIKAI